MDEINRLTKKLRDTQRDLASEDVELQRMKLDLEKKVTRLAQMNKKLKTELAKNKKIEDALKKSEDKFYKAFNASPVIISISTIEGCLIDVNEAFHSVLGYTRKEAIGHTVLELGIWDNLKDRENLIAQAKKVPFIRDVEVHFRAKDRRLVICKSSMQIITVDGKLCSLGMFEDITERKQAEEALRDNEAKFYSLFQTMNEGVALHELIFDEQGQAVDYKIIDVNPSFKKHTGISQEKARNRLSKDVYGISPIPNLDIFANVTQSGEPHHFTTYLPSLQKHFDFSVFSPKPGWFATVFTDITQRKIAEEALQRSEEKFAKVFWSSPTCITITRLSDGSLIEVNDSTVNLLGYSHDEFIGHSTLELGIWSAASDRQIFMDSLVKNKSVRDQEYRLRTKDGRIVITRLSADVIVIEGESCILSVFVDITDHKRAEETLHETNRRLLGIMNHSPALISIFDQDGRYLMASNSILQFYRKKQDEIIGKSFSELWPLETATILNDRLQQLKNATQPIEVDDRLIVLGKEYIFHTLLFSLPDFEGKSNLFCGISTEISDRKKAETLLRKEAHLANLLQTLYKQAPQLTDKQLYELTLEQAVQLTESKIGFFNFVSDDQETVFLSTWNSETLKNCTAAYESHYPIEQAGNWADCFRLRRPIITNDYASSLNQKGLPRGHSPILRVMSVPVVEDEKVRVILGVGNKPTDYDEHDAAQVQQMADELHKIIRQRRAELELRKSEEKFRKIIQSSPNGITLLDLTGAFVDCNEAALKIHGFSSKQALLAKVASI